MILLSTLGWDPEVVVYPAKKLRPDGVVVFYGYENKDPEKDKVISAVDQVKMEIPGAVLVQVDPFSMGDCIIKMKKYLEEDAIANITGGTKLMGMALTLTALHGITPGIPVIYVRTENGKMEILRMPVSISKMQIDIRGTPRKLLEVLVELDYWETGKKLRKILAAEKHGGKKNETTSKEKEINESLFHQAKERLLELNLIEERKEGKELKFCAFPVAKLFVDYKEGA